MLGAYITVRTMAFAYDIASSTAGPYPSVLGLSVVCARSDNVDTARIGGRVMTQKAQDNLNSLFPLSLTYYLIVHPFV